MRMSICSLAFVMAVGFGAASAVAEPDKAKPEPAAQVFIHPEKLSAKDKLSDSHSAIEIKSETTLIWIDLVPGARFSHSTKYVLISADGVRVVDGTWWPILNGKDLFRDGKVQSINFPINLLGK